MHMVIGLDLVKCVNDMIDGIRIPDAICIMSPLRMKSSEEWDDFIEVYWKNDFEKAKEIINKLRRQNKIIQYNLITSHWVSTYINRY